VVICLRTEISMPEYENKSGSHTQVSKQSASPESKQIPTSAFAHERFKAVLVSDSSVRRENDEEDTEFERDTR
jgi:hypothetical protein